MGGGNRTASCPVISLVSILKDSVHEKRHEQRYFWLFRSGIFIFEAFRHITLENTSQLSDMDRKMLRLLLDSEGSIPTHEISEQLGMPISTVQRRRKRLEEEYLIKHYSLDPMKFGYRRIDLLIYTEGGETMTIGKELLEREEVTYAARTIGEHTIDFASKFS